MPLDDKSAAALLMGGEERVVYFFRRGGGWRNVFGIGEEVTLNATLCSPTVPVLLQLGIVRVHFAYLNLQMRLREKFNFIYF
jgi:hypothetical protein